MKTSHISIIIGIMIASCFILPDATAQVCFGGQACGEKPSSSFMDGKNVAVSLKFYSNSTVSNNIHYLWLRFFDKNTNQTIPHVSFFINATKDDKVMMHELFYTNTGSMTLQFSSGSDIEKWIVNGNAEPVLGGMMSDNDVLPIETSAFTSGTYHIHLVVLALVFANGLVDQNNPPTFDSWWSVDGKGNISQYDNSANSYVNPGPPPDPIFLVDNRHQIDNFLTNHEILIHYNANPIVSGSSPLDLEIKLANNGNLILDDKKYLILNDTHQAVVFWRFIPTLPGNYTLEKYNNGIHTSTTYFTVSDSKETLASPILVSPFKQMQAQIPISDIECEN
ncbi:MAG TPA: hypothetical protein VFA69_09165, partial [Candidatus Nitrosotalea sp.]|nr:hypothetical protein [Candidatus Nitrosotalea sp.]